MSLRHRPHLRLRQDVDKSARLVGAHCGNWHSLRISLGAGSAWSFGLCLASACDIRVAAQDARMGYTFATLGIHPGMAATHNVPRVSANGFSAVETFGLTW